MGPTALALRLSGWPSPPAAASHRGAPVMMSRQIAGRIFEIQPVVIPRR
jgi:hypothetical protein